MKSSFVTSKPSNVRDTVNVDIRIYGKNAQANKELFKIGSTIRVEGRLKQETWRSNSKLVINALSITVIQFEPL